MASFSSAAITRGHRSRHGRLRGPPPRPCARTLIREDPRAAGSSFGGAPCAWLSRSVRRSSCPAMTTLLGTIAPILLLGSAVPGAAAPALDPAALTKYVDALPIPPLITPVRTAPSGEPLYEVRMSQFEQKLHRDLPPTTVRGYDGLYP